MLGLIYHKKTKIKLNSHLSESDRSEILLNFMGPPHKGPFKILEQQGQGQIKNRARLRCVLEFNNINRGWWSDASPPET